MTAFFSFIHAVWNWLVSFSGSVIMIFFVISAVILLIEAIWYHLPGGNSSPRKGGDRS